MIEKYYLKTELSPLTMGELHFDTTTKQYKAFLYDDYPLENGYPTKLFGFKEGFLSENHPFMREVDTDRVETWFKMRVTPSTRENIVDLLRQWGVKKYDVWEIMKATNAKYCNEPFYMERFE